jgi:hypothetical protein
MGGKLVSSHPFLFRFGFLIYFPYIFTVQVSLSYLDTLLFI